MRALLIGAALAVGAALTLGACGSDSPGTAGKTTILPLTATNFATIATVPATSTTTTAPVAGAPITGESAYTIASGDYPSTIAAKFHVKFQDLLTLNGWTLVGQVVTNFPAVGTQIKIPAGATAPGATTAPATATTTAASTDTGTTVAGATTTTAAGGSKATTTTIKGSSKTTTTTTKGSTKSTTTTVSGPTTTGGACSTGSYVIKAEDTSRVKVATKFDVTVAQLDAANASTKGYSSFYPGLTIVIPAKSGCA